MKNIEADSHNFGRKVFRQSDQIIKPRPIGLEWLFLSTDSLLRKLLNEIDIFCVDDFVDPRFDNYNFDPTLSESSVDFIQLDEVPLVLERKNLLSIGSLIALVQWFGMGDLHSENIFIGFHKNKFIASPIDIECIFEEYKIPSQSLIIPSFLIKEEESGLAKVFDALKINLIENSSSVLLFGYVDTYLKLSENTKKIFETIKLISSLEKICSRVILRSTKKYYDHISGFNKLYLHQDEKFQAENGDIPYFFKFLTSQQIYYWKNEIEYEKSSILLSDFEKLEGQLPNIDESFIDSKAAIDSIKFGAIQIAKYFDHNAGENYTSEYLSVKINYSFNNIEIEFPEGKYKCAR
jgi:hypothetical protein